jgi:hypothetical protein
VNGNRRGMSQFMELPYELYRFDRNWCPRLRVEQARFFSRRNPFMRHCEVAYFLAHDGRRPVARVTAHVDAAYNMFHGRRQGFFGFFESTDNVESAGELMLAVEAWLKQRGASAVMGPFNFSTNHEVGFLTEGFDRPPVIMMPYTKPYYPRLLTALGYHTEKSLFAYWLGGFDRVPTEVARGAEICRRRHGASLRVRNLRLSHIAADLAAVMGIYADAWSDHWGFVPLSEAEIAETARSLRFIADPRITVLLFKDGQPAACLIAVPNINEALIRIRDGRLWPSGMLKLLIGRRRIRTARVMLMGVKRKFQRLGLDLLLYDFCFRSALDTTRYRNIEMSWILEDNLVLRRALQRLGAVPYKQYTVLGKRLED